MEIFVPDGIGEAEALGRTTELCVAAHQDDIELMCYQGILNCFGRSDAWFCGCVTTDGAGSPRSGLYADCTDAQMREIRKREQRKAAVVGEYGAQVFLGRSSAETKDASDLRATEELRELLERTAPEVVYTHNLMDKHPTHVAVAKRVVAAIRQIPREKRPKKLFGCEVWRSLDWMADEEKVLFDVSGHENLAAALVSVFDSQICGGKRYDLAAQGRRLANATYSESHGVDTMRAVSVAMDLSVLVSDDSLTLAAFAARHLDAFRASVLKALEDK